MQVNGMVFLRWEDGSGYDGEWKDGLKHGKGVYHYPTTSHILSYEGYFEDDKKQGKGKMIFVMDMEFVHML